MSESPSLDLRITFLHIPKTAGTSFHLLLSRYFTPESICPVRNRKLDQLSPEDLTKYKLFSGHYFFNQIARIAEPNIMLTFLRSPQQRLLSLYNYQRSFRWEIVPWLEAEGYDTPRFAKTLSLRDYLRCEDWSVRQNVSNAIARYLVGLEHIGSDGNFTISDDAALNIALTHLQRFHAIGLAEYPAESLSKIGRVIDLPLPEDMGVHNTFDSLNNDARFEPVAPLELDDETRQEIVENIRIDQEIYNWSLRTFAIPETQERTA